MTADGMTDEEKLRDKLWFYTLAQAGPAFVHQYTVDAFAAQNASYADKPIKVVFALAGLYLHLERGFDGRQVQRAHMQLAAGNRERAWTMPRLPMERGAVRVADVLASPEGLEREVMVDVWCSSVWQCYEEVHGEIAELCAVELGVW